MAPVSLAHGRALEAFWDFDIPDDLQQGHGCPPLSRQAKRKILGENLARLLGIDLDVQRQRIAADRFSEAQRNLAGAAPQALAEGDWDRRWCWSMNRLPLLWICGAPGTGKSTVAWELFGRLQALGVRTGYVDIDQLGMCYPVIEDDPDRTLIKARNLGAWVETFHAAGAQRLLVSGVAAGQEVETFAKHAPGALITWVLLHAAAGPLRDRLYGLDWDRQMVDETLRYADEVATSSVADVRVDVTGLSVAEVAAHLLEVPVATGDPAPTPTADRHLAALATTPVLWICGARAVGKSTVGWRVFRRLVGAGVRTLFLDLPQLGFLEPAAPDDPHNHRVKAQSLGALIAIAGAHVVVMTGRVEAEDVLAYNQHLPVGAELMLVRLSADRDTLREHLRRRAQGGGWRETGDPLPGSGPAALERWLGEATAENERLERHRLGDTEIGVDGREPEAIASDVFAATPRLQERL